MPVTVLVGGQWGDEGKGKLVDTLVPGVAAVVRYQGGPNAGHTVYHGDQKLVLHQVPTGILHKGVSCAIAPGVLLDPWELVEEIKTLKDAGCDTSTLVVSPSCHIIMPWHRSLDAAGEDREGAAAIGTTRRGIGPCAMHKVERRGIRLGDLLDEDRLRGLLAQFLPRVNQQLEALGCATYELETLTNDCLSVGKTLKSCVGDTQLPLWRLHQKGERILMEGAQGALLDIDWGTYPFVTSTSPVAGGACTGGGLPPTAVDQVIGIFKAYTTRVGNGPFPTEFPEGDFADSFRKAAGEFGATTGRPRRCGWFDELAARYSCRLNGYTSLVLTKLDVLDGLEELRICSAYEINGTVYHEMPEDLRLLEEKLIPVYESVPGWSGRTAGCTSFEELPPEAQNYIRGLEARLGVPVAFVSTGPRREELLRL